MKRSPERELNEAMYPVGSRVRLIYMNDEYTRLESGDEGVVTLIDSMGTVHVNWDSGAQLGVCLDAGDRIEKVRG